MQKFSRGTDGPEPALSGLILLQGLGLIAACLLWRVSGLNRALTTASLDLTAVYCAIIRTGI